MWEEEMKALSTWLIIMVGGGCLAAFWAWAGKAIWYSAREGMGRKFGMALLLAGALITVGASAVLVMVLVAIVNGEA